MATAFALGGSRGRIFWKSEETTECAKQGLFVLYFAMRKNTHINKLSDALAHKNYENPRFVKD